MLERQNPYDFKVNLLQIHKRGIRCTSLRPLKDEFEIKDGIAIVLPNNNEIILTAARDFEDYLLCSMQISALITYEPLPEKQNILISICQDIGTASGYMGSRIYIDTLGITIEAYDERSAAQAFYYLEDLMNLKKAPYLKKGKIERKALFSPRITQSPFGMYEAFAHMAHLGYDAIDLWLKDACTDLRGYYIDLRLLSERAAKYGIDLYVELYAPHKVHPDEAGAQEFYDNLYGSLFAHCPNLKGITLLGEANQFHSKDPHVGKAPYRKVCIARKTR